jgi:2-hydroxy-6-oxonona-2,4-dienedioate hydrolase
MQWIFGFALLLVLPVAAAGYSSYRRDVAAARARVSAGSQMLATRCGPVEYARLGDGPPILVLHGASGGWDQGLACARGLIAHGFQLIAPSRFGYLRTPLPADPSPEAEADAWAALLDALKIPSLPVIGFSAGAAPAVQLALRHPARVSHLVLMVPGAGGLYAGRAAAPPRLALEAMYRFDFAMWLIMRLAPRFMYRLVGVPPSLIPVLTVAEKAQLDEVVDALLPAAPRRLGLLNEAKTQRPGREYVLERVSAPTLLISAADDVYQTLPVARHAAKIIRHSRLIEFKTGGHLLLGHENDIWRAVASALGHASGERHTAA